MPPCDVARSFLRALHKGATLKKLRGIAAITMRVWPGQSDKIPHTDMGDDHIDTVISHRISPYPISMRSSPISISNHILSLWVWLILLTTSTDAL
jgi:hypothetical protein